jgi:hypothetical protein
MAHVPPPFPETFLSKTLIGSFRKNPQIMDEELLKVTYLFTQPFVSNHLRSWINVVDTIQLVECHCIAQKMIALERGIDAKNALAATGALNIVQEDGNHGHLSTQEPQVK